MKALIIVDVQADFCSGGSLAVPNGDEVVSILNEFSRFCASRGWLVFASRDWHKPTTKHFLANGGEWPVHCVVDSDGAKFHKDLDLFNATIITKGAGDSNDYSAFTGFIGDNNPITSLETALKIMCVEEVLVGGLATDFCVKETVLSACKLGLKTNFLSNASRAVSQKGYDLAIDEMTRAGARCISTHEYMKEPLSFNYQKSSRITKETNEN